MRGRSTWHTSAKEAREVAEADFRDEEDRRRTARLAANPFADPRVAERVRRALLDGRD